MIDGFGFAKVPEKEGERPESRSKARTPIQGAENNELRPFFVQKQLFLHQIGMPEFGIFRLPRRMYRNENRNTSLNCKMMLQNRCSREETKCI